MKITTCICIIISVLLFSFSIVVSVRIYTDNDRYFIKDSESVLVLDKRTGSVYRKDPKNNYLTKYELEK